MDRERIRATQITPSVVDANPHLVLRASPPTLFRDSVPHGPSSGRF